MKDIVSISKKRLVILDGGMGTELQRLGMPEGVAPENWCLKNKDKLAAVHREYKKAGADIIYTATFGANRLKLSNSTSASIKKINKELALVAREAAGKNTLVAGDIGPTGKLVEPFGKLSFEKAVAVFKEQVKGLLAGGVDLFVIETMIDIQEARAALLAVKELTNKFTIASMTFEKSGFTLGGTTPLAALITLQGLGADCFGCNCSTGPESMVEIIRKIKLYAKVPLLAKPNAGLPKLKKGKTFFDMNSARFAALLPDFIKAGVNFLGGCCGTTPAHIKALSKKAKNKKPRPVLIKSIASLSSARSGFVFKKDKQLTLIGESINPTGKKELSSQLKKEDFSLVRELARNQERAGADILDINVSVPGTNEAELISKVVKLLSKDISLPLAVDSSDPEVVERFLRIYPARGLINSISADPKKNKKLLSLASKYGAMFIGLPLTGKSMPKGLAERKKNVRIIYKKAKEAGLGKDDFIIDGLVLSAASNRAGPGQTLETIEWARTEGFRTVVGLSNVSFGLPKRNLVNASFLSLAQGRGLDCVIANPLAKEIKETKRAVDFLLDKKNSDKTFFKDSADENKIYLNKKNLTDSEKEVYQLILEGQKEKAKEVLKRALAKSKPYSLVKNAVVPALERVGDLFDKRIYFLPQLISSAEAAKEAFKLLKPRLRGKNKVKKTIVILATVKDDIHDIGKNIVALLLENHGFEVIDLGKDVSASKIVEAAKDNKALLVGLSALMTTTMVNMEEVVNLARKKNLKCKFIVGGAVVTKSYAKQIGAEYASDGLAAVRAAGRLNQE